MNPSVREIIDLNIRRYRELLRMEADPSKRQLISDLLTEEEANLERHLTQLKAPGSRTD